MAYKQAVPTSGGRHTKIYVSKLKINRPKIRLVSFKSILVGWTLWRGGGGQVKASKRPNDASREKNRFVSLPLFKLYKKNYVNL